MRILIICDKTGTAIDILANFIKAHNRQHDIEVLPVHPKRPDAETIKYLSENWHNFDLIHWMYWKSWSTIREQIPEIDGAKSILSHFNPYDIDKMNWKSYHDENVFLTQDQLTRVGYGELISLAINEDIWKYKANEEKSVGICANRIESKKGIREIAEVCKELDVKLIVMGRISDRNYWESVKEVGAVIEFHENVPFEVMPTIYQDMGVYVCNSVDNFETGPMPVFEAMLSGVPVISRRIGTVAEVAEDGKNVLFFNGKKEMKEMITEIFENKLVRNKIRDAGWSLAKNMTSLKYAWSYNKLYHKVVHKSPLVSVITATIPERESFIEKQLESIKNQTHNNVEHVVMFDNKDGYNLADTRNRAVIESRGEYLLFLDDRLKLDNPDTIKNFVKRHQKRKKTFLWGDKGAGERKFVENFSFTTRQDFINAGMFNTLINVYGGMSQEIRTRLRNQGWSYEFCSGAKAKEIATSGSKWNRKDDVVQAKNILYKLGL